MNLPRRKITFKGKVYSLYSIRWLAQLCNRDTQTLRKWQRLAILPEPVFVLPDTLTSSNKTKGYYRWYCAAELVGYSQIIHTYRLGFKGAESALRLRKELAYYKEKLRNHLEAGGKSLPDKLPHEDELEERIRRSAKGYNLELIEHALRHCEKKNIPISDEAQEKLKTTLR